MIIYYDFFVGQQVFKCDKIKGKLEGKLGTKTSKSFEIVHVNCKITIKLYVGVAEQINISCTTLYKRLYSIIEQS